MSGASPGADTVVVGAGIVGLAVARALLLRRPGSEVVVVDKESAIGTHQTAHNSGVVHSGVYYRPGSARAELCVRGARELVAYCRQHAVPVHVGGKLIVAVAEGQLTHLARLESRATSNGVSGVRRLSGEEIAAVEPHAAGVAALHVPTTAVTDFAGVAHAMSDEILQLGGSVRLSVKVVGVKTGSGGRVVVEFEEGPDIRCRTAVVCAGAQSDRLAPSKGSDVRIVPFRGSYLELKPGAAGMVRSMIYPVPDGRFPFLGVHFTRHIDGRVSCGPNAVLALAREQYRRLGLEARDALDVLRFPGVWRLCRQHWRVGLDEVLNDVVMARVLRRARMYLPDLRREDVQRGDTGVRAQVVASKGDILDDFLFRVDGRVVHVLNAPSPAATASLAIAERIVDQLEQATSY